MSGEAKDDDLPPLTPEQIRVANAEVRRRADKIIADFKARIRKLSA